LVRCKSVSILVLVIITINPLISIQSISDFQEEKPIIHSNIGCDVPTQEIQILNTFPIDLDILGCYDNLSLRNEILNLMGNGSTDFFIRPWGSHFTYIHIEGSDKWAHLVNRIVQVRAPCDGELNFERTHQ